MFIYPYRVSKGLLLAVFLTIYSSGALFLGAEPLLAAVIEVPSKVSNIQDAVEVAEPGDTVLVAPGTYRLFFDNLRINGKNLIIKSSGGAARTIITGRGNRPIIFIAQKSRAVIQGFTIVRESDSDHISVRGGAIYCAAGSSPVIRSNIIRNNRAVFGAGIYCDVQSTPEIRANLFSGNRADTAGGAIFTDHARALIAGNRFEENSAGSSGGAIGCNRDSSRIYGNIFWNNCAIFGGALSCDRAATWIYNNTLVANRAEKGGAIMIDRGSVRLLNLIFFDNSEGDLFSKGAGPAGRPLYSDLQQNNFAGMNGNISQDPQFVSAGFGDFQLRPGSPCIDSGSRDPFYKDRDGSFCDMGAYGGPDPFDDAALPNRLASDQIAGQ